MNYALTREGLSCNHDKTIVCCGFDPTFISKTQPKTGIIIAPLVIRALSHFAHFVGSAEPEELVSCPVRALLEYYERARQGVMLGPVSVVRICSYWENDKHFCSHHY